MLNEASAFCNMKLCEIFTTRITCIVRIKWLFFVLFVFQAEQVSTFGHTLDEWLDKFSLHCFVSSLVLQYSVEYFLDESCIILSFIDIHGFTNFYYNLINFSKLFAYVEKDVESDANKTGKIGGKDED